MEDSELTEKLTNLGCKIKSNWTHKYYAEYSTIENGIRFVRLEFPNNTRSLPYAITIGSSHLRLKHNGQTRSCNKCLSEDHLMRDCPQYECRECGALGHSRSRCPTVKCYNCNQYGHKSVLCNMPERTGPELDSDIEEDYNNKAIEDEETNDMATNTRESTDQTTETPVTTKPPQAEQINKGPSKTHLMTQPEKSSNIPTLSEKHA
ncbi:putative zinc finger CCHC domain-containing protein 10-like [Apostichopus japonicus]|uniref:Putative zinc finger CCHC domain-containing protein 10-like n=1 Tax=Stichopus japonicus TaxID=307972 RepID=A0A2G8K5Q5_STIJA|nr:putative zinc finger CCHC domain-containing protein 10-like [Apostichopus japonicus]